MMNRTCLFALFLPFFMVLFVISDVGVVCALTINSDGSVDLPDCVEQHGNVYVITSDSFYFLTVNKDNIVIDGNGHTLNTSGDHAVGLMKVNNVTLKNLIITGSSLQVGIVLQDSFNCTIIGNKISNTKHVNPKFWATSGIHIYKGGSHTISNNNFSYNARCILLGSSISPNVITENNVTHNSAGFVVMESSDNLIYNNNFINNVVHVVDSGVASPESFSASVNFWDDGVTGNYWDDYNGTDVDGDGIGDTPYVLFEDNQDNYPLTSPVEVHAIPEFPSWVILPFVLLAAFVVAVYKNKLRKTSTNNHV